MNYDGINAKVQAMSSRLLKYDDYAALSRLKTVEEVGLRLRELRDYQKPLETVSEMRREPIEQKLGNSIDNDFDKVHKFLTDNKIKSYLDALFLKFDIQTIKMLLNKVFDEKGTPFSANDLSTMVDPRLKLDVQKLAQAKTITDFIEALSGSKFYKTFANVNEDHATLFEYQMQLDLYYYMQLWKAQDEYLSGKDKQVMAELIGTEIDLKNILWIYRFKAFYNINPSLLYTYLVPIQKHLSTKDLNRLVETRSKEAFIEELSSTHYKINFDTNASVEDIFYKEMLKIYKNQRKQFKGSIAVLAEYFFRKELEINNITSLIEGVRYGLDSKEIMSYLHFPEGVEVS